MSDLLVVSLAVLTLVSNFYWWRRLRATTEALTTSQDRDQRVRSRQPDHSATTVDRAASAADCEPDELPERIEQFRETIRTQQNELERVRRDWARAWWDAYDRDSHAERPAVVVATLPRGTTDDVQTFADVASECPDCVVLAVGDDTFAVHVGDDLDDVAANDIAADISAMAGGGSGGSETFATGGGADPDGLEAAVKTVSQRLRNELSA